ncbi:MAG: hypothetical protein LQ344_001169 [Seirophora lacunosa]|nr:MAG: hypothetical protein LQ344_001169 [Seirophora lacunosa]
MAFSTENDPYPPSLPKMGSPGMALYEEFSTYPSSSQALLDHAINDFDGFEIDDFFRHATTSSGHECGGTVRPADLSLDRGSSPSSSPASSPSSSIQHERHTSSNSSRSATFGSQSGVPDEAPMHRLRLETSKTTAESLKRTLEPMNAQKEVDMQMHALFDFDSAANNPGESASLEGSFDKANSGTNGSVVSIPTSFRPGRIWETSVLRDQPSVFNSSSGLQDTAPPTRFYGDPTGPALGPHAGFVGPNSFGYAQPMFAPPAATFPRHVPFERLKGPELMVHSLESKTRVETQVNLAITLVPMPPAVTRLHLPNRTIAKPKLVAKQPPAKFRDMLELDVMPVCATAMKKPGLLERAFAVARGEVVPPLAGQPIGPSPSEKCQTKQDGAEKMKPTDGGAILICDKCIDRERRRLHRHPERELTEEDLQWRKGEKERIVLFNEREIVDWKPYNNASGCKKARKGKGKGKGKGKTTDEACEDVLASNALPEPPVPYPESAGHGEPEGYHVIITLKDHRGNCIAQQMSNAILITDDHKHAAPQHDDQIAVEADTSRLHNENYRPSAPPGTVKHPYHLGQSHSTTDLPMHNPRLELPTHNRSATSVSLQHQAQGYRPLSAGISTPAQDLSYRTSNTLTPRNSSRAVSPSGESGPATKRHKGSGSNGMSHRPLVDLSMTQMSPTNGVPNRVQSPSASPDSSNGAADGLQMGEYRGRPHPLPRPVDTIAVPPAASTPPTAQGVLDTAAGLNMFEPRPPPSTAYETLLPGSEVMAGVSASHQSHARSPEAIQSQPNTDMTAHAQALHHSLLHVPGAIVPAATPMLARIIPSEGPVAGGIDVTIIGEGFHRGLDVLFADAVASKTTVLNSQLMVCVTPPSFQQGLVPVSLRGWNSPEHPLWFRYVDSNEKDLMRLALSVYHHRNTGEQAYAGDVARSIIQRYRFQDLQHSEGGAQQQSEPFAMNLELAILSIIDLIDQTDSVVTPCYDATQPNGQTMLHVAASLGYHRLVAGLLARGMNSDLLDRNGMSAMHMACLQGHTKVVRKLLSAGGDSTLRSLLGLRPIDMATTEEVYQLMAAPARHTRSRSASATPASHLSRASSMTSLSSIWGTQRREQNPIRDTHVHYKDALIEAYRSHSGTPADARARSRRNSAADEQCFCPSQSADDPTAYTHLLAASAAMAAWRENLAGQIQHFQQSVQRTLPNLQIPNLPPLPNLEGYQEHPMVRRISSFVPRMSSSPSPPAYDEIYPENTVIDTDIKKASAARTVGDAFMEQKCAWHLDRNAVSSPLWVRATSEASTKDEGEELRLVRAGKVKTLANDRKLFFIWIPLLIGVVIAMIKDWAPQIMRAAQQLLAPTQDHLAA